MIGHNIQLEPGFCSAINKGIFVHADDATTPKHFTSFLTPPISEEDNRWENKDLLKLAVQTKFNENDVTLLTKMDVTIPMKTQDTKHHMKNIAGLAGRCFGDSSIIYESLQSIADHIEEKRSVTITSSVKKASSGETSLIASTGGCTDFLILVLPVIMNLSILIN